MILKTKIASKLIFNQFLLTKVHIILLLTRPFSMWIEIPVNNLRIFMSHILQWLKVPRYWKLQAFFLILNSYPFIVDIFLKIKFFVMIAPWRKLSFELKLLCAKFLQITLTKHNLPLIFALLLHLSHRHQHLGLQPRWLV